MSSYYATLRKAAKGVSALRSGHSYAGNPDKTNSHLVSLSGRQVSGSRQQSPYFAAVCVADIELLTSGIAHPDVAPVDGMGFPL